MSLVLALFHTVYRCQSDGRIAWWLHGLLLRSMQPSCRPHDIGISSIMFEDKPMYGTCGRKNTAESMSWGHRDMLANLRESRVSNLMISGGNRGDIWQLSKTKVFSEEHSNRNAVEVILTLLMTSLSNRLVISATGNPLHHTACTVGHSMINSRSQHVCLASSSCSLDRES